MPTSIWKIADKTFPVLCNFAFMAVSIFLPAQTDNYQYFLFDIFRPMPYNGSKTFQEG